MKKVLISSVSAILAMFLFVSQTFAFQSQTVDIECEIYNAFLEVENLITAIEGSDEITYDYLLINNSELVANVSSSVAVAMNATAAGSPPFISAFLWGCIFNIPGMLIVGITTGFESSQMKKSAWGCLFSTLIWGSGGYFFNF